MGRKSNIVEQYKLLARVGNPESVYRVAAWREFLLKRNISISFIIDALNSRTRHVSNGAMLVLLMLGDSRGLMAVSKHMCKNFPRIEEPADLINSTKGNNELSEEKVSNIEEVKNSIVQTEKCNNNEDIITEEGIDDIIMPRNESRERDEVKSHAATENEAELYDKKLEPLYSNELHEIKDKIVRSIAAGHFTGQKRCAIIIGQPLSGKTILLEHIINNLKSQYGLKISDYRNTRHMKDVIFQSDVVFCDDIDLDTFGGNDFIRYYKTGGKMLIMTTTDLPSISRLLGFVDPDIYKIPVPCHEDIEKYICSLTLRGFKISDDNISKMMELIRKSGRPVTFSLAGKIFTGLMEDHILHERTKESEAKQTQTLNFDKSKIEKICTHYLAPPSTLKSEASTVVDFPNGCHSIKKDLRARIIGQDNVIEKILPILKIAARGLSDPSRPAGVLFFYGPTGCGKTEMAKAIADLFYNGRIHKIDMSNYSESHSVSRLGGSPPGYVGFNQVSPLLEFVKESKSGVILFDEVEKCHEDVKSYIMDLIDTGYFRDSAGRIYDCRKFIIILTSNIGFSRDRVIGEIGYVDGGDKEESDDRKILLRSGKFLPEFVSRLQIVLKFNPLSRECLTEIAEKLYNNMLSRMKDAGFNLSEEHKYIDEIIKAYDKAMGARSMKQYIETIIKERIIDEFLKKNP